jgi:hypothetical protein
VVNASFSFVPSWLSEICLTFAARSDTVTGVMDLRKRVNWFYAYSFTQPVLPAGEVALT